MSITLNKPDHTVPDPDPSILRDLEALAADYLEMRMKRDEYEAQMNNLSAQMQALMIAGNIPKHEGRGVGVALVQGTSRTLNATKLLEAGVDPDQLNRGYVIRPTQYVTVRRKAGEDE